MVELINNSLKNSLSDIVDNNKHPTKGMLGETYLTIIVNDTDYIYTNADIRNQDFERLTNYIRTINIELD